jgi:hypothetical protein
MANRLMRIGVLFNCQVGGLVAALQALLPGAEVHGCMVKTVLRDPAVRAAARATLQTCDHVICWDAAPRDEVVGPAVLRGAVRNFHLLPSLQFAGYHPDMLFVMLDRGRLLGPTEYNQSRIAIAAYLGGLCVDDTVPLYNALVFGRLGYFAAFHEHCALLREDFGRRGIAAAPLVARLTAGGCFMHSFNHPKIGALLEVARATCALLGAAPATLTQTEMNALPDALLPLASHPVYPEIAARLGIPPEGDFRARAPRDGTAAPIALHDFIAASFASFARAPRAALLAADRVATAMAALGLQDRAPAPAAPAHPAQNGTAPTGGAKVGGAKVGAPGPLATLLAWARAQAGTTTGALPAEPPAWLTAPRVAMIRPDTAAALRAALGTATAQPAGPRILLLPAALEAPTNAAQLAAMATRHGFAAHHPAALTPAALAALLHGAAAVIMPGGALMAYLLFCPPGTQVIELAASGARHPLHATLCRYLGLGHSVVPCTAEPGLAGTHVDLPRLRRALRALARDAAA